MVRRAKVSEDALGVRRRGQPRRTDYICRLVSLCQVAVISLQSWEIGQYSEQRRRIANHAFGCTTLLNNLNREWTWNKF